jgi:hypothetical protein
VVEHRGQLQLEVDVAGEGERDDAGARGRLDGGCR